MKRFVTKKVVKMPRYKFIYIFSFIIIMFIILINIGIKVFLKKVDQTKILTALVDNSFSTLFASKSNLFYQNIFGFPLKEDSINLEAFKTEEPIIYLYNTFQTEKYLNNYYSSYSINPVITQVNLILAEYLKEYNLKSIVETESVAKVLKENNIDYSASYRGSRILMEKAKNNNPSLKYFLDIDLCDDNKEITTYSSNKNYAKVLFVVGTDNNNYLENQKFAKGLNEKLEHLNKDLSRGISLRGKTGYHGIYNQDFSPFTLRMLIGGKENTIDEVNNTLKILAQVIADYVRSQNET